MIASISKFAVGVLATLVLAWGSWATTTLIDTTTKAIKAETRLERLPIMEEKIDLLMAERNISNPNPVSNSKEEFPAYRTPTQHKH